MSVIFWFSGTGNSLYTAKRLATDLGGISLYPMKSGVPQGVIGGAGEKVGFVFPSYFGNLPRFVRSFVEELAIDPASYIFAIVTMGGMGQGSIATLKSVLLKKSLRLDYGRTVRISGNYIVNYNPVDKNKVKTKLDRAAEAIQCFSSDITAGKKSVKGFRFTTNRLYKDIASLDMDFFTEDSCKSCGQCVNICPVGNIRIENGRPVWLHKCEHCVACISWCPAEAIQYGSSTKARRRYQNPEIKVDELLSK